ncbi:hypothetical protein DENSPDRAFT_754318, partial [Dentipellis sp. KUC8613]
MEKCLFIGYPEGYKGWRFYNPRTKKILICERATFDERDFPGLSLSGIRSQPSLTPPASAPRDLT